MRCACALADAGIERTYNFKQEDILKHVEVGAAQKVFDLGLPDLGPYKVRQSRGACDFSQGRMQPAVGGQRVVPDAECLLSRPQPSLVLSAQPRAALGSFTRHPHAHPRRSRTTHCAAPSSSPCCCRLTSPATGATCCWGGRRGHLAMMDWSASQLVCEVQVRHQGGGRGQVVMWHRAQEPGSAGCVLGVHCRHPACVT